MLEAAQVAAQCEFVVGAAERRSVGRLIESGPHPDKKVRAASGRTIETPMSLAPRRAHRKIIWEFFLKGLRVVVWHGFALILGWRPIESLF